jgi:hypothetical protein
MMAGGCRKIRIGEANLEDCFYHRLPRLKTNCFEIPKENLSESKI